MKKLITILPIIFVLILVNIVIFSSAIPTIIVDETELVDLKVTAIDEDGDPLTFNFTPPLNEYGQWQTTYGDYGEYKVQVSASDGNSTTVQDVLIIVNKVNWPPAIEPIEDITIKEGDKLILKPKISDEENDPLTITISEPIGNDGEWQTDYDSAGNYKIEVSVSDSKHTVSKEFTLTVTNVNRAPELEAYFPQEDFSINEGEQVELSISGIDPDGDSVSYAWYLDGAKVSELKKYIYKPDFDSAGMHEIRASVSDSDKKTTAIWNVEVLNVNRAPEFKVVDKIVMNESDLLILEFEAYDPDGDKVEYAISEPIGNDGEWQTDYDSAGIYHIDVEVMDNESTTKKTIELIVNDIDRAPLFEKINDFKIDEGETKTIELKALDQDGDKVTFVAENLPEGASLEGNVFTYTPPYDTVKKQRGIIQKTLNLNKKEKEFVVTFTAAGKELTTKQNVKITVNDVNLPPALNEIDNIMVDEGSLIDIRPSASDPDGDELIFTFTEPLDKNGKWQTGYNSSGVYTTKVTVSDGSLEASQDVVIVVNDVNRPPVFENVKNLEIIENSLLSFRPAVIDPDGHVVELSAINIPEGSAFIKGELLWKPDYDFCKGQDREVIVTFIATDELNLSTKQDIKIVVKNNNRKPIIFNPEPESSIAVLANKPVTFSAKAIDLDNDKLSYEWEFGGFNKIKDATPTLKRTFTEPGEKIVRLKVSDGIDISEKVWKVRVVEGRAMHPVTATTTPAATTASSPSSTVTYIINH